MAQPRLDELATLIERQTGVDGTHQTAIAELTLTRISAPSEPIAVLYEPSLCLVAQGTKHVLLAGEVYRYDPAWLLLVSIDLPVATQVIEASPREPYLALRVALDPAVVGELVADGVSPETRGTAPARTSGEPGRVAPARRGPPTRGPAREPARHRGHFPRSCFASSRTACSPASRVRGFDRSLRPVPRAQRIARAIRWLKDHFAEPLRIEALAREVRLSPSALHRYFKAVTAMSPLQYQKRLRLQEARRLMLGDGLDASGAGFRVGYGSPSQFSREYSRLFGAPPRRDVEMLRLEPQPLQV